MRCMFEKLEQRRHKILRDCYRKTYGEMHLNIVLFIKSHATVHVIGQQPAHSRNTHRTNTHRKYHMYGEAWAIKKQAQLMCRAPELAVTHFLLLHVIFPKVKRGAQGFLATHDYQQAAR
jgi:hypothetical protein